MASVNEPKSVKAPHHRDPARRLRSGAWLLQRSWRHPHRLPAGWRSERFARSVDRTRGQLRAIHSLRALADSYARESLYLHPHGPAREADAPNGWFTGSPLEVAYVTRWIELDGGRELHAWSTLCRRAVS